MKEIKLMNEYLSSIAVLNVKVHNLHWNVVGKAFYALHSYTEGIYDRLFEEYDEVAERIKMKGDYPLVRMADYLANSRIEEAAAKDFSADEVVAALAADLQILRTLVGEVRSAADAAEDPVTVGLFEGYMAALDKDLWFLSALAK